MAFHFVTATMYKFSWRTWKNEVEPKVTIGERTSVLDITWIRNISATERLFNEKVC